MKQYKGYLIDLDGTMYRGIEKIEEACEFVRLLKEKNIPYLFVTNNSSKTPKQVAERLREFSIPATDEQIFTSSMATANFMYVKKRSASVYVIGEEGIQQALIEKGFKLADDDHPDFVVVGIDRNINYEKLSKACIAVRNGAIFISTNADIAIPTERGLVPGNGSITSVIAVSTTIAPIFIGKPEPIIMEQALKVLGTSKEETLMVGDNYDTDIMAGMNSGLDTLLVHTGITMKEHLASVKEQPTYAINSLEEWYEKI
ncbi:TIGR01457 family HAD-type hydrolase [Metabacillus arenae]|uniref:Acid sugar phosphatase n=1 Tax=Metabacillus arenae TaxID=2771434 RepID=A0A926RXB2_9BACI|nr:TIGR01457 family HAD-type hydrolase [Metabacillus arenae]MBD1380821.1 TIGR01457 family HAD-type hydrolase [Metabacillus arenae]